MCVINNVLSVCKFTFWNMLILLWHFLRSLMSTVKLSPAINTGISDFSQIISNFQCVWLVYIFCVADNVQMITKKLMMGPSQIYINYQWNRDGVAHLVERRIWDPKIQKIGGSNPACVRSTRKNVVRVFPSQKCCANSLSVCLSPVCTRTHKIITYAR